MPEWIEGMPPEAEFTQGIFFVRIEEPELGGIEISFETRVWYGDCWEPFRGRAYGKAGMCCPARSLP